MRRWFLSYHSPDQALGERVKAALERKDTDSSVFFAPSSLRAGGFWSKALAAEIAQSDAFILMALQGQNAPGLPFLRRLHWVITRDPSSEEDVARLFDAASGSSTRS